MQIQCLLLIMRLSYSTVYKLAEIIENLQMAAIKWPRKCEQMESGQANECQQTLNAKVESKRVKIKYRLLVRLR